MKNKIKCKYVNYGQTQFVRNSKCVCCKETNNELNVIANNDSNMYIMHNINFMLLQTVRNSLKLV